MTQTRRSFLTRGGAFVGAVTILPYRLQAATHGDDVFETGAGGITVHPISHASFVMETPFGTIYVDPVGQVSAYEELPAPDLVLITHEHGDHYKENTLAGLIAEGAATPIITNPAVYGMLPSELAARSTAIANGESIEIVGVAVEAIPAYNITADRTRFHPQGRDNGYVVSIGDFRVYISGDTEDIPEMRALKDIDLAFLCMNLPFTMDVEQAASAVAHFGPRYVYPYHYRGRDGGTQDPDKFAALVSEQVEVKLADWYG